MKTKVFGIFSAFVMTGTTAFAQMGGGQGGYGAMNHSNGWMNGYMGGGMWLWTLMGVLVVVLLVVLISKVSTK